MSLLYSCIRPVLLITVSSILFFSCLKIVPKETVVSTAKSQARRLTPMTAPMVNLNVPSINFFNVLYYYAGYYGSTGTYSESNKQQGHQMLSDLAARGIKAVRFFAAGAYCESCVNYPVIELWKNNRTAFYQAFDQLVNDANSLGIQLIPSLVTGFFDQDELNKAGACVSPTFLGGSISFMPTLTKNDSGTGCHTYDCIADPAHCKNRTGMIQYALDIASRYSNSSTILFWEIGNELNLMRKSRNPQLLFVTEQQIADYVNNLSLQIKTVDPSHMICAGITNDDGPAANAQYYFTFYYSQLPYDEIATVHLYDGSTDPFYQQPIATVLQSFNGWSQQYGKTLYIGECGVAGGVSWTGNNFNNFVMSLLMAKTYLNIPLASPWNWESKNSGYNTNGQHPEMEQFSIDPGEDDDLLSILKWNNLYMWPEDLQPSNPIVGDFDGDHHTDFGVMTQRGLFDVALMNNNAPSIPSQWLFNLGDPQLDPGGAPFQPICGDWNGDGKTDIGVKSKDGRWFVAFSNAASRKFVNQAQWLASFGNDNTDPGGAPFVPISGDWNGDGYTDIGLKSKDGRWFVAFADPAGGGFVNQAQWLSNFGNDYTDPGGAPFQPITGDFNGDGRTDIGLRSNDGRWFVAFADPAGNGFINQAQWLANFGNDHTDPGGAPFRPITGDWNGDNITDIGLKARDGRWFVAFTNPQHNAFVNQAQWLAGFGDDNADPGGAPFIPITGDWDGDHKTDIGLKAHDGRWFSYISTGSGFTAPRQFFQ